MSVTFLEVPGGVNLPKSLFESFLFLKVRWG